MKGSSGRMLRSTGILALSTGISRILGFVRDVLMASLFGASIQAQAFVVAFRLPNLLRDLVAEGAVASAIVPGLTRIHAKKDPRLFGVVSRALFWKFAAGLCVIGILGVAAAPFVVRLVAPGFAADPEKFALTVRLTRILFPFIVLVGLWAYFMGFLNSLGHFALPALGPAILNIAMIAACLWWAPRASSGVVTLTWSVLIGGVVQLAIQLPVAIKNGFRFSFNWRSQESNDILKPLGPRVVGSAVYQANVILDTILASLGSVVGEGAVAALYYANRLVQLPLALFGTATAQASLPLLAEQAAAKDKEAVAQTLRLALRMVSFVVVPASVGLIVLGKPIVTGLFERGAFDQQASLMTSQALACYSLGLLAYSVNKVLTGAFYALHDTWTPVRLAIEVVVLNLLLSLVLMGPLKIAGLALAASITNSINSLRLARRMERHLGRRLLTPVAEAVARMAAAALVMGIGCSLLWLWLAARVHALIALAMTIVAGGLIYLLASRLFGVAELSSALRWLRKILPTQPCVSE